VRELRRLRDEGVLRYVGISGYPVDKLSQLAETVLQETGEPLDIVMSYANFTLQNTRLHSRALPRLIAAGVDVVPNASPLGMGLLRRDGVPIGAMGDFHPAPDALRSAVKRAAECATSHGEKLEVIAIRFALESWLRVGARAGGLGAPLAKSANADPGFLSVANLGTGKRLGVSVMGVSNISELDETLRVWHSIVDGLENWSEDDDDYFNTKLKSAPMTPSSGAAPTAENGSILTPSEGITDRAWSHARGAHILELAREIRDVIGAEWVDYVWDSPSPDFVNTIPEEHVALVRKIEAEDRPEKLDLSALSAGGDPMLTPPSDVERQFA
jgi:hypothetical protein